MEFNILTPKNIAPPWLLQSNIIYYIYQVKKSYPLSFKCTIAWIGIIKLLGLLPEQCIISSLSQTCVCLCACYVLLGISDGPNVSALTNGLDTPEERYTKLKKVCSSSLTVVIGCFLVDLFFLYFNGLIFSTSTLWTFCSSSLDYAHSSTIRQSQSESELMLMFWTITVVASSLTLSFMHEPFHSNVHSYYLQKMKHWCFCFLSFKKRWN